MRIGSSSRRTPATIVAIAALVLVGGSAAALPGKNSVDKNDLKKNVVKSKHVKNDSLTGNDIAEATLAKVPAASAADVAGNLVGYQRVGTKKVGSTGNAATADDARAAATEVALFGAGPFTFYGKCFTDTTNNVTYAGVYVRTTENGALFQSNNSYYDGDGGFLDAATVETDRAAFETSVGANNADVDFWNTSRASAIAPSGAAVEAKFQVAVKNGTLVGGDGIYGPGNVCIFTGNLTQF